ncbi:MAG: UPF0175 family protein [Chloroherpetonaceae bacterium]|nr:UPF0175 family protein [Chloroherpetonaceae bacterium]
MKTLTIELPDTVEISEGEVKRLLAAKLYERALLSLGQAAEVAGLSKRAFMEMLGAYGVSLFHNAPDELEQEIQNVEQYRLRRE